MSSFTTFIGIALVAMLVALPAGASAASASASFADDTITARSTRPSITGEAEGTKSVRVVVRSEAGKIVYKKDARVRDGEWTVRISKRLKAGEYDLAVYAGKSTRRDALDEGTLTIEGKKSTKKEKASKSGSSDGILTVSSVPLLTGGTARLNASVPVAYVKITNQGTEEVALEGMTLQQTGTAAVSAISTFSTSDDKGGSRATVNAAFKGKSAFVPLAATVAPGQMRIFTVKAGVAPTAPLGSTLKLDVTDVTTDARVYGAPLRGTTWTIGL
ncbi:MAG TPA: Ig-like domain-containing protein [Candidatus Paceibacterota bacterium]|nr:Ig-like domain-containing protein [Candidatus Paceibacterota bacterium]